MSCSKMDQGYNLQSSNDLPFFSLCHVLFSFNLYHKDYKETSCSQRVLTTPAKVWGLSHDSYLMCFTKNILIDRSSWDFLCQALVLSLHSEYYFSGLSIWTELLDKSWYISINPFLHSHNSAVFFNTLKIT